jgi:carbamoyltransferase
MNILAMNFNHDGAAFVVSDGVVAGQVTTERFSRKKKHPGVREEDLREVLRQSGSSLGDIDVVYVLNYRIMGSPVIPELHGTTLEESWVRFGLGDFRGWQVTATTIELLGHEIECVVNPGHHLAHAALPYYFSPFDSAMVFAYDPVGTGAFIGRGNRLEPVELDVFDVSGVYDEASELVGFPGLFGAGKTMGLAPYGRRDDPEADRELDRLLDRDLRGAEGRREALKLLKSLAARSPIYVEDGAKRWNATLAHLTQTLLEKALTRVLAELARVAKARGVAPNLCLAGGTALNSVANQECFARSEFQSLYLHPCCGDDGTALGAALFHHHHLLGQPRRARSNAEAMYSVRTYGPSEIDEALARHSPEIVVERTDDDVRRTARLLADGEIIGWFQGAGELGPRALGNRSILCDPRRAEMKDVLNGRVKRREAFRPFAPSVLREHSAEWFGLDDSPFMLRVATVQRSGVPAVTHVDGTARPQTVAREDNPRYHALIEAFRARTGVPLILNTSFNTDGEPLVESPEDAVGCFLRSGMDRLVFPGAIVSRRATSSGGP